MNLTAENVNAVVLDCLFTGDEIAATDGGAPKNAICVSGIIQNFGFHPERLKKHQEDICSFIEQLPRAFIVGLRDGEEGGGGWSFLNLCTNKDDQLWCDSQRDAEALYALAAGLNLAGFCMPQEFWTALPGGMPYVWFSTTPVA